MRLFTRIDHRKRHNRIGAFMKTIVWVSFVLLFSGLAGCTQATPSPALSLTLTPSRTLTATATLTPTLTEPPTATRKPTNTPIPSYTPKPTHTPLPPLVWNESLTPIVVLENFYGVWSSTANKLAGVFHSHPQTASMALANAPDFDLQIADIGGGNVAGGYASWSPDGLWVLFSGPNQRAQQNPISEYSEFWIMDRNGENAHSVYPENVFRWLNIVGWLDHQTVMVSDYSGGGNRFYYLLDFPSGKKINITGVYSGSPFTPSNKFVPVVSSWPWGGELFVIAPIPQPEPHDTANQENTHKFPGNKVVSSVDNQAFFFKDWAPETNQMLVSWFTYNSIEYNVLEAQLLLWNVDTDSVHALIHGGVDGFYSPNGKYLALVTLGQASAYTNSLSSPPSLETVPDDAKPYLQLLDINSGQTLLSLPVISEKNTIDYLFPVYETEMVFSPNSRYLAFLTYGHVQLSDNGLPIRVEPTDQSSTYLNILDLETMQLVRSFSVLGTEQPGNQKPLWSPTSNKILYIDESDNWLVFDLAQKVSIHITQSGGSFAENPSWSYDGQYLLFYTRESYFDLMLSVLTTYIFELSQ